jgi:CRP/FNR family transcriptional regulator, cyclic AMP receptor protein
MPADPTQPFMTLEALRSVPLFAALDDAAARSLRDLLQVRRAAAGTQLFRAGDDGDAMFLIEGGRVRIHIEDEDGDDLTLADIGDGDFFGEMAILDGKPRSAHATVSQDADLGVLSREDFHRFVRANPDVAVKMMGAITERLRRTDELLRQRVSRNLNEMEEERMTLADRMADAVSAFGGSWKFIFATVAFVLAWILVNSWLRADRAVDPFPYSFLDVMNGIVAALLTPIILISQNRQGEKDRLRADLDYQVNLKNELALAEVMRRLDVLETERLPLLFAEQKEVLLGRGAGEGGRNP